MNSLTDLNLDSVNVVLQFLSWLLIFINNCICLVCMWFIPCWLVYQFSLPTLSFPLCWLVFGILPLKLRFVLVSKIAFVIKIGRKLGKCTLLILYLSKSIFLFWSMICKSNISFSSPQVILSDKGPSIYSKRLFNHFFFYKTKLKKLPIGQSVSGDWTNTFVKYHN